MQKFLLGVALLAALAWNLAHASEINGLRLSTDATGTRAEIALDGAGAYKVFHLKGPDRLVVDLPATRLAGNVRVPAGAGVVSSVRTGQPESGTTRVVFDLSQPVKALAPQIISTADGAKLVVQWPGDGEASPRHTTTTVTAGRPATSLSTNQVPVENSAPTPTTAVVDTAASSAAATSRLISEIAARTSAAGGNAREVVHGNALAPAATGVPTTIATGKPAPTNVAPATATAAPTKTLQEVMRGRGVRPLVIAIDPGHGGQDPGAVGKSGTREKDVVLQISKELARQVNATPGLKAYLTRDTDEFIPLNDRAKRARKAKADMFISIHADAAENRGADGSSVYVLSLKGASSQRARWLANKENSSDLVGGVRLEQTNNTLASVLIDLTQSGHMRASEDAAGEILDGLTRVGNIHKPHIERANFAVLRTSDMPAMLVETAFISNPEEEVRLQDPRFQGKLASAVLSGINTYFTRQPPPGTMYAARASADIVGSARSGQ